MLLQGSEMTTEFKSRLDRTEPKHMHCPSCGGDLNQRGQWLLCRKHFVKDIRELERALHAIAKLSDYTVGTGTSMLKAFTWIGDLANVVSSGSEESMKAADKLYEEASRFDGEF